MTEHAQSDRRSRLRRSSDSSERESRTIARTQTRSRSNDQQRAATREQVLERERTVTAAGTAVDPGAVPAAPALPSPGERTRRKREWSIQRSLEGTDTSRDDVPEQVLDVIGSGGRPLDFDLQRSLETRMDADFGNVRIHTGAKAAKAADAIDARAFTCGNDIVFNSGEYDPESPEGQFLLAHELAHVKQQNGGSPLSMMPKPDAELEIDPDPQLEREADQAAEEALAGGEPPTINRMGTEVHVQRLDKQAGERIITKYRSALLDKTDLNEQDLEEVEAEIGLDVSDTEWSGSEMHDALNFKLLDEAEAVLDEVGDEITEMAAVKDGLEWHDDAQTMIDDLAGEDGIKTDGEAVDALDERKERLEARADELRPILERADAELQRLLGDENIRLTEEQKSAVERAISEGADVAGGTVSSVVLNYLYGTGFDTTLVDLFESLLENEPTAFAAGVATVSAIYKGIKTARGYLRDTGDEIGDIIDTEDTDSTRFD